MRRAFDRSAYWKLAAIAAVIFSVAWGRVDVAPVQADLVPQAIQAGGLIAHFHESGDGLSRVTVLDPAQRRMAVYHVNSESGAIQLKSVRNLSIDLQLQDFNSGDPSPIDMQKMLDGNSR